MDRNAHIPTEEIEQDIRDTEREITSMRHEIEAFQILANQGDRLADMRRRARETGIEERQQFIAKLQGILKSRSDAASKP
jgi:hypothetical protein